MQDAVAEVLADRIHVGERRIRGSVVASLAIHLVVFALLMFGAHRPPASPTPNVVNIRLAPARPTPAPVPASRPATPAAKTPRETPAPRAVTPPAKPEPAPQTSPAKREPFAPKQESVFGRSTRPVAPPEPAAPAVVEPAAPSIPALGEAGVTGLEGGDFPYTIYVEQMVGKIGRNWFRPETGGEPLVVVYFVIERDGMIRSAEVTRTSGSTTFDRAARRAILDSSPLAPLPFGYRGTWLGVHLTFH